MLFMFIVIFYAVHVHCCTIFGLLLFVTFATSSQHSSFECCTIGSAVLHENIQCRLQVIGKYDACQILVTSW